MSEEPTEIHNGTWPLQSHVRAQTSTFQVPLRTFRYFVGIYFPKQVITDTYNTTVDVSLTGDICQFLGTFWDGNACTQAHPIAELNSTFTRRLNPISLNLFYLHVPELTAEISMEISDLVCHRGMSSDIFRRPLRLSGCDGSPLLLIITMMPLARTTK